MRQNRRGEADLPPGPARDLVVLFRLLRGRTPLTIGQISAKSGLAAGHISEVLRGWKAPSPDAAESIARTLGAEPKNAMKARALAEALTELNRYSRAKARDGRPEHPLDAPLDIPPPPSRFVGRAAEIERIRAAVRKPQSLHRATVVQIYGAPGIGKTALACLVAHEIRSRYADGCLFVDLGSLDDLSALHARLLARLGVPADSVPADPTEARALYLSKLYRRSVLIVADNVTSSEQAAALVPASPACAVIAIGRRHLDTLDDSCAIRLGPLAAAESETLLAALLDTPGGSADAESERIVAQCGGVPLAIRAAAARLRAADLDSGESADLLDLPARAEAPGRRAHLSLAAVGPRPTEPVAENTGYLYPLREAADGGKSIGIVTGDLRRVRNVDFWVNSENTDMIMSRFDDYTISAIIRYDGSLRDAAGRVIEDTIADELAQNAAGCCPVAAGTAVLTGPGRLAGSNNVRGIVHVAAVYGEPGAGYRQVREVGRCVTSALAEIDRAPGSGRDVSVLFPLLGTGQGRGNVERTAAVLVDAATDYLARTAATRISTVWFLAYTYEELAAFQDVIGQNPLVEQAA